MIKTLTIDKAVYEGNFYSFTDNTNYFIPYVLEGEVVDSEIVLSKKNCCFAKPLNIISKSEKRIEPECPIYSLCGGCSYLHTDYENELEIKKGIIQDCLKRIGKIFNYPEIRTISSQRYHYRDHCTIKFDGDSYGFHGKKTNSVIPFPEKGCLLLDENINNYINNLPKKQKSNNHSTDIKIAIGSEKQAISSQKNSGSVISIQINNYVYQRNLKCFFQSNQFLRNKMIEKVLDLSGRGLKENILDIACGIGFFTIPLSYQCNTILGIDNNKNSINYAGINSKINKSLNAKFLLSDFSKIDKHEFNTVVVDPPRTGLTVEGISNIINIGAEKIIYVSCNPATYSRDAAKLLMSGYNLSELFFIDNFPCTHHIEIISLFRL